MRTVASFVRHAFLPVRILTTALGCAGLGQTSCVSSSDFETLQQAVQQLQQLSTQQQAELATLKEEDRRIWRGLRCNNQQVADFMTEAEKCAAGQCPQRNLERVLGFMIDQRHVLIRLKPGQQARDMASIRLTQLQDMLRETEITPLSRILILTLAVSLNRDDAVKLPETMSEQLRNHLRRDLRLAPAAGYLGPFPVNCEQKSQLIDAYARHSQSDKPVPGEPKSREPQVAIWIFKVDC